MPGLSVAGALPGLGVKGDDVGHRGLAQPFAQAGLGPGPELLLDSHPDMGVDGGHDPRRTFRESRGECSRSACVNWKPPGSSPVMWRAGLRSP